MCIDKYRYWKIHDIYHYISDILDGDELDEFTELMILAGNWVGKDE
jgi:hypothetical protein